MHMYTKKCGQNYHFHGSVHSDVNLGGLGKAWGGLGKAWVGTGSELGRNWVGTWVGTLAHDVRFTFPLVELVKEKEWTDHHHFTPHATTDVLRHALRCVRLVLQPQQDNISLVCVLCDGWNRALHDEDDRSRYWRCRLDFSKCTTLHITVQNVV